MEIAIHKAQLQMDWDSQSPREPYYFVLKHIFQVNQERSDNPNSMLFKSKLACLTRFIQQHYVVFAEEQSRTDFKPELCKTTAITIWECLTSGPALIDYFVQHQYAMIYRVQIISLELLDSLLLLGPYVLLVSHEIQELKLIFDRFSGGISVVHLRISITHY